MPLSVAGPVDERRRVFAEFARRFVAPRAEAADRSGRIDEVVVDALRERRFLAGFLPAASGGLGMDQITYGLLTAEIAHACSATRTLLTVHGLVGAAVQRWGSAEVKRTWLPQLACGRQIGAFALSEPNAGSDAAALQTVITRSADELIISGEKSWISFGQRADVFLIFGRMREGVAAVLVPGSSRNLSRHSVTSMVGTRGSMMAHLRLDQCSVPVSGLLGRPGFGLSHVAATALDHGRYSVAWGAVGIIDASLEACAKFVHQRSQFSTRLEDLPLIRARLTRMVATARAARLLCMEAGRLRDAGSVAATAETMLAKYFASKAAVSAANEAVQIHGARGLLEEIGMERLLRDAKVTEIIEGSSDALELELGRLAGEDVQ